MTRRTAAVLSPLDLILLFAFVGTMLAFGALAADAVVVPAAASGVTLDLTGIIVASIGGVLSLVGIVATALINSRVKDKQAAAVLEAAVKNSLGALQQASEQAIPALGPNLTIPGVPATLQPGVQYVLDHAGPEAERFGITPPAIAAKIDAQIGLTKIAAIVAATPVLGKVPAILPGVEPLVPGALAHA
jgi:hypothetical protein